jgi:hypothetical protein
MTEIPTLADLSSWPVFDTPYRVGEGAMEFVEIIVKGADEGAEVLEGVDRGLIVAEQEWNADFTERRITRIQAISRDDDVPPCRYRHADG